MASCGTPSREWRPPSRTGSRPARRRMALAAAGLALLGLSAGCGPTVIGSPPKVEQLGTLRLGVSTMADVRQALGEPRGDGMGRFVIHPVPWRIWFYEYAVAEGVRLDLKYLLVFFREDRYDGHLWFSAAQLLEREN